MSGVRDSCNPSDCSPLSGSHNRGYVASPSATLKFAPLSLRKLHISSER